MSKPGVNTALTWLGLRDGNLPTAPSSPAPARNAAAGRSLASVRPSRRPTDVASILTFQPATWAESRDIAAEFRLGTPVIVNLADLPAAEKQRMLDFMLGLQAGLEGHLKRVTETVFLLTPAHIEVGDEEDEVEQISAADDLDIRRP